MHAGGNFPRLSKTGRISPIYKKGNEEFLENYRPVSTLTVFGKIFEKLIYYIPDYTTSCYFII